MAVLVAVQFGLVWGLSRHRTGSVAPVTVGLPQVSLLSTGTLAEVVEGGLETLDPADFALVSTGGFSGSIWLRRTRFEPGLLEWTDPPRWLGPETGSLGMAFGSLAPVGRLASPTVAGRPLAEFWADGAATFPVLTQSAVRIEGELAQRRWLNPVALPGWEYNDVLLPSQVQVVVGRDGSVLSATLLSPSGLPAADQRALELARAARFEPWARGESGPVWVWGRMVFRWLATGPPRVAAQAQGAP